MSDIEISLPRMLVKAGSIFLVEEGDVRNTLVSSYVHLEEHTAPHSLGDVFVRRVIWKAG